MQTHTNISAATASHVATGPTRALHRELSSFPWWVCRPCGPGRCQDEAGAEIDCERWIIQPSPPPFEWVSSVTFRRAFIAKQEKIILHRPPRRPWTLLINETKHLQHRHTDTDILTQIYTRRGYPDTHTHVCRHTGRKFCRHWYLMAVHTHKTEETNHWWKWTKTNQAIVNVFTCWHSSASLFLKTNLRKPTSQFRSHHCSSYYDIISTCAQSQRALHYDQMSRGSIKVIKCKCSLLQCYGHVNTIQPDSNYRKSQWPRGP